jgi:hypothetical protein
MGTWPESMRVSAKRTICSWTELSSAYATGTSSDRHRRHPHATTMASAIHDPTRVDVVPSRAETLRPLIACLSPYFLIFLAFTFGFTFGFLSLSFFFLG